MLGFGGGLEARLVGVGRNRFARGEAFATLGFGAGEFSARARGPEIGFEPIDRGLIGTLIDRDEQVALLYVATFFEMNFVNVTGHAGADLDRFRRGQAAGEFIPFVDFLRDGLRN